MVGLGKDAGTSTQVSMARRQDGSQLSAISAGLTGKVHVWGCGAGTARGWPMQARKGR